MVKIDGKYKLEKNENLVPYLCALGMNFQFNFKSV